MKSFFRFFAERHMFANLITIMIVLMGGIAAFRINRSEFPKVDLGIMTVTTLYPGASPEDVELNVTNKIEDEVKSVTGIKQMTSTSMENISIIVVTIDPDVSDQDKVKNEVREAVARVSDFPQEVTESPRIYEEKSALWPILEVGVSGDNMSYAELREYARLFEKKLKEVPGVAQIERYGWRAREIQVEVSPDKMMKYQLPMGEIIAAIQARNIRATGGSLESYTSEKNVVTLAQFRDPQEVGDVIVRSTPGGAMVRVKELAVIHDDFEEERLISHINGKTTISFEVTKDENADIIETVDAVNALVDQEKKHLPAGSTINFLYTMDRARYVRNRFNIVSSNAVTGLLLVVVVLALFLNIRSAFWVAMGIPFSLLGVIMLLPFFGADLNSATMTGMIIVLGIIVDDAIVISENIFQRRAKGDSPIEAAVNGIHDVYLPVLTTITTTLLAFLPMFFMKGALGKFVFSIPLTICLALFMSTIESFFVLPAHLLHGLETKKEEKKHSFGRAWFNPIRDLFEKLSYYFLKLRYVLVPVAVLVLAGSLFYAANFMDFVLFPAKGAEEFTALLELPTGSSLQATADKAKEIENIIDSLPEREIASYAFRIGANFTTEVENNAILSVYLTPYATRDRTANEIVEELRGKTAQLEGIKNITFNVVTGGLPSGKPVEMRVIGADDDLRKLLAADIVTFLSGMDGVKDVERSDKPGKDEIAIQVNHERLARYGLTVADIAQNVRIAYDGEVVTSTRYGEEDVEFRVIVEKAFRQQIDYIKRLRIPNRQGELISIGEIATLDIAPGASVFHHYEGERVITVTGDVFQEKITPLEVTNAVLEHFDLHRDYPGMRIDVGGEAEESRKAMNDLMLTFGLAALGIYFLLMLLFNSMTQPLLVILSIPFGLCGVIIAFALHGQAFSFLGMMGVIGMAGVVVNDSLVLVDHLNGLTSRTANGPALSGAEGSFANKKEFIHLVASGTADRLRPIVLTTLTTVAGLLPLAYGLGGQDLYMSPMALALGYGLLFATPITLVLLPSLYMIGQDIGKLFRRSK